MEPEITTRYGLQGLNLRLSGVDLPIGLRLDEVLLEARDAVFETDPWRIVVSEPGRAVVRISQESFAAYLEGQSPAGASGFKVEVADGLIKIAASATLVIQINVLIACRLEVVGGKQINLLLEGVSPPVAQGMLQGQLEKLNPIIDLAGLPLNLTIEEAVVADGWIEIRGSVLPPDHLS